MMTGMVPLTEQIRIVPATINVDSNYVLSGQHSAYIDIAAASGTAWRLQLGQQGLDMRANKTYKVSLEAKAESPRSVILTLQLRRAPFDVYWSETIQLTTTKQTFTFEHINSLVDSDYLGFILRIGNSDVNFWMDNIIVQEQSCNDAPDLEICDNGIDDDGDGQIDCADGDCDNIFTDGTFNYIPSTKLGNGNWIANDSVVAATLGEYLIYLPIITAFIH